MTLFAQLMIVLLFIAPKAIRSDFCGDYKSLKDRNGYTKDLKFIPTKDVIYVYLKTKDSKESVYELDVRCSDSKECPKLGSAQDLSQVFSGVKDLDMAFIQDHSTYIFSVKKTTVHVFGSTGNATKVDINKIWNSISYAATYVWSDNDKTLVSRFIPPKSKGQTDRRFAFSQDIIRDNSVELFGEFGTVFLRDRYGLYSFDDYLVPHSFDAYLQLPNGDAIFNVRPKPLYIRKEGIVFSYYFVDIDQLFGCDNPAIDMKPLKDTLRDSSCLKYPKK